MLGRGLVQRRLWGRGLWGLLAAVAMMFLTAYSVARWYSAGVVANKYVERTDYVLAWLEYQNWLWGSIALASFVVTFFLLGLGVRPTPSGDVPSLPTDHARREKRILPLDDRFDQFLDRLAMYQARYERWVLPLQQYLGRLVVAALGTFVILLLGFVVMFS